MRVAQGGNDAAGERPGRDRDTGGQLNAVVEDDIFALHTFVGESRSGSARAHVAGVVVAQGSRSALHLPSMDVSAVCVATWAGTDHHITCSKHILAICISLC